MVLSLTDICLIVIAVCDILALFPGLERVLMDWKSFVNEATIGIALVVAVTALVIIVIVSGPDAIGATGLRDLAILLAGALAGTKVPKS